MPRKEGFTSDDASGSAIRTMKRRFPRPTRWRWPQPPRSAASCKDEEGRPVAGAKVSPSIFFNSNDPPPSRAEFRLEDHATDRRPEAAGPARTCLPDMTQRGSAIRIQHADFQPFDVYGGNVTEAIGPKGTVVLRRGHRDHRPGGRSRGTSSPWQQGQRRSQSVGSDQPIVETDADGRFRLEHLPPGETVAHRPGERPRSRPDQDRCSSGVASVELKLGIPRTIQGRVVDQHGKPIAGVRLTVDGWRGFRTLDWKTETGSRRPVPLG